MGRPLAVLYDMSEIVDWTIMQPITPLHDSSVPDKTSNTRSGPNGFHRVKPNSHHVLAYRPDLRVRRRPAALRQLIDQLVNRMSTPQSTQ